MASGLRPDDCMMCGDDVYLRCKECFEGFCGWHSIACLHCLGGFSLICHHLHQPCLGEAEAETDCALAPSAAPSSPTAAPVGPLLQPCDGVQYEQLLDPNAVIAAAQVVLAQTLPPFLLCPYGAPLTHKLRSP